MFVVAPHEDGFAITWDDNDADASSVLYSEIMLEGLARSHEWPNGVVIERYRNEFETLALLSAVMERLHLEVRFADEIETFRAVAADEHELHRRLQDGVPVSAAIAPALAEFPTRSLLPYQCTAVGRHLCTRNTADFSVPGSGKTTVALAYWTLQRHEHPDLGLWVIGPLSCFRPWEDEFVECLGREPDRLRIRGTRAERGIMLADAHRKEMVLCTYHTAWREEAAIIEVLKQRPWLLVLDEAHYVKSATGVLSSTVRHLAPYAALRMILTGTPMPRAPEDLWSLFTFLWPTVQPLGNAEQFLLHCREQDPAQICENLRVELAPFFHRTCKHDLGLPEVEYTDVPLAPDQVPPTQRLIIRLIENRTVEESEYLTSLDQRHLRRWRRARVIRLLQAVSNPLLLADAIESEDIAAFGADEPDVQAPEDLATVSLDDGRSDLALALRRYRDGQVIPAKAAWVANRCRELAAEGKKVVVWAHFHKNVDLLESLLQDLSPLCVTGRIPAYDDEENESTEETREQRIDLFKNQPDRFILLASAAACSEAISLHRACQHAIYFERSFNAAHFIQSIDRIHRQGMPPGTTAHVELPHLPCAIERVLNRRLRRRQAQLYRLLNDPMPIVGFDDDGHTGFFDIEDYESIDVLFHEVLQEIRGPRRRGRRGPRR